MREHFYAGATFDDMVASAKTNAALWRSLRLRASVDDDAVRRVEALGGSWHLLVLSEDWCSDSVSTVPFVDELASRAANLDLRILARDEHPDLMEAHLTQGHLRAIPVVMLLDEHFVERGWWGSRPAALQEWVRGPGRTLSREEQLRERRRWYALDHGKSAIREIVALLEEAAATAHGDAGASASTSAI